jgi:hypothetical protein
MFDIEKSRLLIAGSCEKLILSLDLMINSSTMACGGFVSLVWHLCL